MVLFWCDDLLKLTRILCQLFALTLTVYAGNCNWRRKNVFSFVADGLIYNLREPVLIVVEEEWLSIIMEKAI